MPVWLSFEFTAGLWRTKLTLRPFNTRFACYSPLRFSLFFSGWAIGLQPPCAKQLPCSIRPGREMFWKLPLPQTISRGRDLSSPGASTDAWLCNHVETTPINVCSKCGSLTLTTVHVSKYLATCKLTASQVLPWPARGEKAEVGKIPHLFGLGGFICLRIASQMLQHSMKTLSELFHQYFICRQLD